MRFLLPGLLVLPCFAGCGTMANLEGCQHVILSRPCQVKPRPFGGVANDLKWMLGTREADAVSFSFQDFRPSNLVPALAIEALYIADLPLSLIGDVITLPKTIPYLWMRDEEYRFDFEQSDAIQPVIESGNERLGLRAGNEK